MATSWQPMVYQMATNKNKYMRPIKFKIWDKKTSKWLMNYDCTSIPVGIMSEYASDRGWELVEFTGLLDKNGKEIWEGDIIKVDGQVSKIFQVEGTGVVKFSMGAFNFGEDTRQVLHYFVKASDTNTLRGEIIGDIYTNPELLK